jgi:DNA-binding NtrC family response regulator
LKPSDLAYINRGMETIEPRVMVIDDEQGYRSLLEWKLGARGCHVEAFSDGGQALERLKETPFDVVVTDLTMPIRDGMAVLEETKKRWPWTEVIIVTGFGTVETAVQAMRLGAYDVVIKPFDLAPFIQTVLDALAKSRHAEGESKATP